MFSKHWIILANQKQKSVKEAWITIPNWRPPVIMMWVQRDFCHSKGRRGSVGVLIPIPSCFLDLEVQI